VEALRHFFLKRIARQSTIAFFVYSHIALMDGISWSALDYLQQSEISLILKKEPGSEPLVQDGKS